MAPARDDLHPSDQPGLRDSVFLVAFARRSGLVHLRQTFVLRSHGDDGWPLRAEAWHFCATTSSRMVRTIQCPTYSTISPHRVPKGLARIGIAATFTMSAYRGRATALLNGTARSGLVLFYFLSLVLQSRV